MHFKRIKKAYFLFIVGATLSGCKGGTELANVGGIQGTITSTSNSCIDKTVDVGNKGVAATNPRGTFSDVATVPGTNNYATTYFDAGTSTIKISYWNGSTFFHEVVAGDHLATYMRVVFLSTGVPLVFWTNGSTTVKMASRSTAFGSSGTWTMGTIDTQAVTSRAIEVSVSPLDEVGIVYLVGNLATNAAPKFIVCSTGCSSFTNYTAMTLAAMNIDAATLPATGIPNQTTAGISWCQGVAGDYYPAVTYTAATNLTRYAVCPQADLANCLVNTSWNKSTISASSNLASSLYIDPTIVNDTPKVATITAGIRTYEGTVGCAAPGAWTAGTAVLTGTTATSGNVWLKLLKSRGSSSTGDRYHIIANEAAASARYYNTSSNAFNTLSSWNAAGILQTTTLLATGLTSAGASLLATSNELVATHYNSLAPANMVVSTVRNVTQASQVATVDLTYANSTGNIQLIGATANSTTAARNISVEATSDGRPGAAYIDSSNGTQVVGRLKYAFRDSLQKNTSWTTVTVPHAGTSPMYPALKYDHLNLPWISYYDFNTTVASSRFYLMTNSATDGTGTWKVYQFPFVGTAAAVALPATNDSALAMYYSGGVSYPVMGVIENNTVRAIKASRFNPNTETWSAAAAVTVDTLTATTGATNLTMDNDANGNIVMGWVDLASASPFAGVEYSYSFGGLSWTVAKRVQSDPTTVQKLGQGLSVKLNPVTGYPAMTYYDRASDKAYYSTCSSSPSNCSINTWINTEIETTAGVNGVTTYIGAAPASTRDQLLATALTYDSEGTATVLYPTGNGSALGISGTGNFKRMNISLAGVQTSSTFKVGANAAGSITAVNLSVAGHNVDSVQTANSELVSVFIGSGNELQSRSCGLE